MSSEEDKTIVTTKIKLFFSWAVLSRVNNSIKSNSLLLCFSNVPGEEDSKTKHLFIDLQFSSQSPTSRHVIKDMVLASYGVSGITKPVSHCQLHPFLSWVKRHRVLLVGIASIFVSETQCLILLFLNTLWWITYLHISNIKSIQN